MAKVLVLDIETAPIEAYVWGLWDQNVGLNMIKKDRHMLSWAAKWLGSPEVLYKDQRGKTNIEDDKKLVKGLHALIDEADVLVTQNGKKFDIPIFSARCAIHGITPPSPFKHIDTCQLARKFGFTSNKLEYLSDKLCVKHKKLKHKQFAGFELWEQCLKGNFKAWREMEKYNKHDVLATEELYTKLAPWGTGVNFNLFSDDTITRCNCGSTRLRNKGYVYTASGKYQTFRCESCGLYHKGSENLLSKEKRASLRKGAA